MSTFVNEPLVIIIYLQSVQLKILEFDTFRPVRQYGATEMKLRHNFTGVLEFVVDLLKILNKITCFCWIGLREIKKYPGDWQIFNWVESLFSFYFWLFLALGGILFTVYSVYIVCTMILWGLTKLVNSFHNIYAKLTSLCWHWGWSLPGCLSTLSGSFTSQTETVSTSTWFCDSRGIHSPQCWEPGFNTKDTMPGGYKIVDYISQRSENLLVVSTKNKPFSRGLIFHTFTLVKAVVTEFSQL